MVAEIIEKQQQQTGVYPLGNFYKIFGGVSDRCMRGRSSCQIWGFAAAGVQE